MYLAGVSTRRIEDVSRSCGGRACRRHRLEPEREGVQGGRGMEKPPAGPRLPLRLRRRHLPEAQLGRLLRERGGDGGDRRQRRRLPRGDRRRRGLHRVGRVLAGVPVVAEVARAARRAGMFTGDKAAGMVGSIAEVFPGAAYQRCTVHFYRNALAKVPKSKRPRRPRCSRPLHAMESREASAAKARRWPTGSTP